MGTLNWGRIMLGGPLAGVVIDTGELIAARFLQAH